MQCNSIPGAFAFCERIPDFQEVSFSFNVHQFCCRAPKGLHVARMGMGVPCRRLEASTVGSKEWSPRTGYLDKRRAVKGNDILVDNNFESRHVRSVLGGSANLEALVTSERSASKMITSRCRGSCNATLARRVMSISRGMPSLVTNPTMPQDRNAQACDSVGTQDVDNDVRSPYRISRELLRDACMCHGWCLGHSPSWDKCAASTAF